MPSKFIRAEALKLTKAGLRLPAPLCNYLEGRPTPLALSTRVDFPGWTERHRYDAGQHHILQRVLGALVKRGSYLRACADGGMRTDLDGNAIEPVSAEHQSDARSRLEAIRQYWNAKAAAASEAGRLAEPPPPPPGSSRTTSSAGEPAEAASSPSASPSPTTTRLKLSAAMPTQPSAPRSAPRRRASQTPVVVVTRTTAYRTAARPAPAATRPATLQPFVPHGVVRATVDAVATRRHSVKLIAAYHKNGNSVAIERERGEWIGEAVSILARESYDAAAAQRQVAVLVGERLVDVLPAAARR